MEFDLLTEPWIPVSEKETESLREVGIREALLNAHKWDEAQCTSPLATAATLRMLLAIAHRSCQPKDVYDWQAMWEVGRFSEAAINAYLDPLKGRFDLFDEDKPFLQIGKMSMSQSGTVGQLSTEAATGNNPTLFDHADSAPRGLLPAEAARCLVASQSFALGFGKAAEAIVDGASFPRPYLADAICLRGVTIFLSGKTLFETLMLNLISGSELSPKALPFWEVADPLSVLDKVIDGKRVSRLALGFVERYAWPSRMIRLVQDPDGLIRRAYFTQGRDADKGEGDPMKVFIHNETLGTYAQNLNADKATWRDLQSYLGATAESRRPKVFDHAAELVDIEAIPKSALWGLNVVGLATDPGKAGKFLLWRHDRMSIPAALLSEPSLVANVSTALGDAEFIAGDLRRRMRSVAERFLPPQGNPDPKDVDNMVSTLDPRRAYWARLEKHFTRFLIDLAKNQEIATAEWRKNVEDEAERALRASCDQLGDSTRALRATALVSFRFTANKVEVMALIEAAKTKKKAKGSKKS